MESERVTLTLEERRQVVTLYRMKAATISELAAAFGVNYGHIERLIRDDERKRKTRSEL